MEIIDARGLSCPEPVIMAKNYAENNPNKEFSILLSTIVSKENVSRFLENNNYKISIEENGEEFKLNATK